MTDEGGEGQGFGALAWALSMEVRRFRVVGSWLQSLELFLTPMQWSAWKRGGLSEGVHELALDPEGGDCAHPRPEVFPDTCCWKCDFLGTECDPWHRGPSSALLRGQKAQENHAFSPSSLKVHIHTVEDM